MEINKIIKKDCIKGIKSIDDNSIDLIITSPPYYDIKDYQVEEQIGFGQTYEKYLESMDIVIREYYRVLKPGCRFALNIGDKFLRASEHGKFSILPIGADFVNIGIKYLDFMGSIIWHKITNTKTTGGCSLMESMYYPKNGHITLEYEYIHIFKKDGKSKMPSKEIKEKSKLEKDERLKWFRGVWNDVHPAKLDQHCAAFPVELPYRLIKMYSFYDELVLDPFMGAGTTAVAAKQLGRNYLGFELNSEYIEIANNRLKETS